MNRSVATTERNVTEINADSNIRSIDLTERIVSRFEEEYNIDNEIWLFY